MKKPLLGILAFFFVLSRPYLGLDGFLPGDQQEQTQLRHEVKVTLKLIQVYVTDKKGNPVIDLTKDDFIVYDEGQEQSLTEFERHLLRLPGEKEEIPPEVVETQVPPGRDLMPRKFLLFFDFAFNNAIGIEKARKAALHFIETQVQPQDEVGILSYSAMKSLKLHEFLTTDHHKVREVVKGFRMEQIAGRVNDFEAEYWQAVAGQNPLDASKSGGVFGSNKEEAERLRRDREESGSQTLHFAQKMTDLAKALRYIPGHKHIVFFSSGVPYSIIYGVQVAYGRPDMSDWGNPVLRFKYEDMLKELSAANCSVFPLDTQELRGMIDRDTSMRGSYTLQKMAGATGGKYFGNINFYEQHIEKIQDLTGCYYVLGYYVDDTWDGAYHEVKVEVNRRGLRVHAQKGYFNPKPFPECSDLEKMLHLVDLALSEEPLFQTPVRFPLEVVPCPAGNKGNLCISAKVPVEKIRDVLAGKAEFVAVIFDGKGDIAALSRNEKETYTLTEELFSFGAAFSLSPGTYQCRLIIRNLETGRGSVGSATAVITDS
ncbi:MAG: VWA domain-containing protein, partial [Candidatus Aminicenantales bacterium]